MNTRWSTVLAALGLTVMALGSGRAAHAASVTGHGTFSFSIIPPFVLVRFVVSARSDTGGIIRVAFGGDQVIYAVTGLSFDGNTVTVEAEVTHSTTEGFSVGDNDTFTFYDLGADDLITWSGMSGPGSPRHITSGNIIIRP